VYDALISKRVYRAAWTHEDAMEFLRRETGTAFDPRCVDALERVVTGGRRAVTESRVLVPASVV
jgi:HD-GYP domain-containing protein (c-di-GMP phosphodiesterase class II)